MAIEHDFQNAPLTDAPASVALVEFAGAGLMSGSGALRSRPMQHAAVLGPVKAKP
jgi:hypothetical protein